jgi:hypothetical protein
MTAASRHDFMSTIRNGEPCSRRHYERVIAAMLRCASRDDDPVEVCPWIGEFMTPLQEAMWRIAWAEFVGEGDMPTHPGKVTRRRYVYDFHIIDDFMTRHGWTNADFAKHLGVSKGSIDQARSGWLNSRRIVQMILAYIENAQRRTA